MIFTNKLEKKLTKKYINVYANEKDSFHQSPKSSYNEYFGNIAYNLDLMTYKRIYSYNMKKTFYSYITSKFYYHHIRKELCKYIQHGNTSIMKHCRNVAYYSFACAKILEKKFHINFDYEALIIGAYLHDLFMYDWHKKSNSHGLHGFSHPKTASKNAQELCNVNSKEQSIIESHMWPLTITKIPKSKEAFLVCIFDKYSAILETFNGHFKFF